MSSVALITDTPPFSPPPSPPPSPVKVYMDAPEDFVSSNIIADYFTEVCHKACNDDEPHAHYCSNCMNETDDDDLIDNYYNGNFYCAECLSNKLKELSDEDYAEYEKKYLEMVNTVYKDTEPPKPLDADQLRKLIKEHLDIITNKNNESNEIRLEKLKHSIAKLTFAYNGIHF